MKQFKVATRGKSSQIASRPLINAQPKKQSAI